MRGGKGTSWRTANIGNEFLEHLLDGTWTESFISIHRMCGERSIEDGNTSRMTIQFRTLETAATTK